MGAVDEVNPFPLNPRQRHLQQMNIVALHIPTLLLDVHDQPACFFTVPFLFCHELHSILYNQPISKSGPVPEGVIRQRHLLLPQPSHSLAIKLHHWSSAVRCAGAVGRLHIRARRLFFPTASSSRDAVDRQQLHVFSLVRTPREALPEPAHAAWSAHEAR